MLSRYTKLTAGRLYGPELTVPWVISVAVVPVTSKYVGDEALVPPPSLRIIVQ
jgi:hypothetical protein